MPFNRDASVWTLPVEQDESRRIHPESGKNQASLMQFYD